MTDEKRVVSRRGGVSFRCAEPQGYAAYGRYGEGKRVLRECRET